MENTSNTECYPERGNTEKDGDKNLCRELVGQSQPTLQQILILALSSLHTGALRWEVVVVDLIGQSFSPCYVSTFFSVCLAATAGLSKRFSSSYRFLSISSHIRFFFCHFPVYFISAIITYLIKSSAVNLNIDYQFINSSNFDSCLQ